MTDEYEKLVEGDAVPLALYSKALDEIYELRRALAYETDVIDAHLEYKSFPKSRRRIAEKQMERMRQAACGKVRVAYAGTNAKLLRSALTRVGAPETLTRWQWENEGHD